MQQDQMRCPACGGIAESDSVDIGVGLLVRGNFSCECGWDIDGPSVDQLAMDEAGAPGEGLF